MRFAKITPDGPRTRGVHLTGYPLRRDGPARPLCGSRFDTRAWRYAPGREVTCKHCLRTAKRSA